MASEHTAKAFDSDLQELTRLVAEMGGLAERDVAADQRVDGFGDHALDHAAHLGDETGQFLKIAVESLGGVFRSHFLSPQPNRPVM